MLRPGSSDAPSTPAPAADASTPPALDATIGATSDAPATSGVADTTAPAPLPPVPPRRGLLLEGMPVE